MSELVHAIRHDNTFLLMHYPVVEGVDEKLPGNALHITHSDTIAFLREWISPQHAMALNTKKASQRLMGSIRR